MIREIKEPGDLISPPSMLPADPPDTKIQAPLTERERENIYLNTFSISPNLCASTILLCGCFFFLACAVIFCLCVWVLMPCSFFSHSIQHFLVSYWLNLQTPAAMHPKCIKLPLLDKEKVHDGVWVLRTLRIDTSLPPCQFQLIVANIELSRGFVV